MSGSFPRRAVTRLALLGAALLVAVVLVPSRLAAWGDDRLTDRRLLAADLQDAFVAYWRSGGGRPPELDRVLDYWARYSLVAALLTSALLVTLVLLGHLLWTALLRAEEVGRGGRLALTTATVAVWGGVLAAVWTLSVRVQEAVAPLAAVLPIVQDGVDRPAVAQVLGEVRDLLAPPASGRGSEPQALAAMVDANGAFHLAHAITAALTVLCLAGAAVALWRRRGRVAAGRARRVVTSSVAASLLLAAFFAVVCAANVGTAADPKPSLYGLFDGGR